MKRRKKLHSKTIGLEIGLILGKHLLKTEHLHYGYWPSDLPVDLTNLPQAQENLADFIMSHIPDGVKTILDVGCGVGTFALKLTEAGYRVDCVSPDTVFSTRASNLLGTNSQIFTCCYETMETESRYDLVLFSESFQYIDMEKALQNSLRFLNDGGYLLVCDFFKTDAKRESVLGGGHDLGTFYDCIGKYPLEEIKDIDITRETAPNLEIVNDLLTNVGLPVWNLVNDFLRGRYPWFWKLLRWRYRKRIAKIDRKYFSGERNAENFAMFKSYRLLLYRKARV